jgi:hypothetical protein
LGSLRARLGSQASSPKLDENDMKYLAASMINTESPLVPA